MAKKSYKDWLKKKKKESRNGNRRMASCVDISGSVRISDYASNFHEIDHSTFFSRG